LKITVEASGVERGASKYFDRLELASCPSTTG